MSSSTLTARENASRWTASVTLGGAAVWATFAALAGLRRGPFSIIELLFLLAALVIVPLGIELEKILSHSPDSRLHYTLRMIQLPASLAVCVAFWLPPGRTAAILSGVWLLECLLLAGERFLRSRDKNDAPVSMIVNVAHADLILGAAWLVITRAGWRPMGFQEPIILLTAVHFHYSGFATALIAAATARQFDRRRLDLPGLSALVWLVALLPFAVAAGFVFSPLLRFVAAIALSSVVTALAMVSWWIASEFRGSASRVFLRVAAIAAAAAFSLAGVYAVSEFFQRGWITVPGMANSHGVLNGVGFVLLSLLAWLMEWNDPSGEPPRFKDQVGENTRPVARYGALRPDVRPAPIPDFVARDLYDR